MWEEQLENQLTPLIDIIGYNDGFCDFCEDDGENILCTSCDMRFCHDCLIEKWNWSYNETNKQFELYKTYHPFNCPICET